jgi:predicted peroxiredoxin
MRKLVILGGGTAGTIMANRLNAALGHDEWQITVVDKYKTHYYQPGFLFIPFGIYSPQDVMKPKRDFIPSLEMIHDSGGEIYACKAAMDMFHYTKDDLWDGVDDILTVGDFYQKSAGAQIIFT